MLSWFARYFITSVGVFLVLYYTIYDWYIYSILFVLICMIPQHKSLPISPHLSSSFLPSLLFLSLTVSYSLLCSPCFSSLCVSLSLSLSLSLIPSFALSSLPLSVSPTLSQCLSLPPFLCLSLRISFASPLPPARR